MAGVYIHIPFCQRKCAYCDFYSEHLSGDEIELFLTALNKEIIQQVHFFDEQEIIRTLFFGGGTPSLLNRNQLTVLSAG